MEREDEFRDARAARHMAPCRRERQRGEVCHLAVKKHDKTARKPYGNVGFVFDAQLCIVRFASCYFHWLLRDSRVAATVRGTQRVRAYTTPQVRLARRRASCPFPSSRARRRAQSRARAARALAGPRDAPEIPVFTLVVFGAGSRVSLASAARSSDTLAARRRRGALSESHARAGLTARRARRPGGGVRGLLL